MRRSVMLALALASTACSFFVPESKSPIDHARAMEAKCGGSAEPPPFTAIEHVEPEYARVMGGPNGSEARLRGARLHVRPIAGATAESLTRTLRCHEAAVVLGKASAPEPDPFVLPGHWLGIEVRSDADGFAALVEADERDAAELVLARARAFLRRQELVPPSVGDGGAPASSGGGQRSP